MARLNDFRRFLALGPGDRRLLAEACARLAIASAATRLLPFRRALRLSAVPLGEARSDSGLPVRAAWAVRAAAARAPFRAVCLQQALALQAMLRRRGIDARLHYGALNDPDAELRAHVWVSLDGRVLIGEWDDGSFACLLTSP